VVVVVVAVAGVEAVDAATAVKEKLRLLLILTLSIQALHAKMRRKLPYLSREKIPGFVQHGGKTAKLKSQCMPCLIHRHYQYIRKINTMLVHREQLKSRAMQLSSRTKSVHGPDFEETSAALQYDAALS